MQVGKRTTLTNNDRVLLSRLIDAYGRSQIIEEISMFPKPRAGRPKFVGGGEGIWLSVMVKQQELIGSRSAAARSINRVCKLLAAGMPERTSPQSGKAMQNTCIEVEKRRQSDPEYKAHLDRVLKETLDIIADLGGLSGSVVVPGRMRASSQK
jgi:hypothetical protein